MDFKLIERGYTQWMLMLPGWSFMPEIFLRIELPFNFIFPCSPLTSAVNQDIGRMLETNSLSRIHIIGWSLGATAASLFASEHPELTASLCLISVMRPFGQDEGRSMMQEIEKERRKALQRFHRLCFTGQREDYKWFAKELQERAIEAWDMDALAKGLDFIAENSFDPTIIKDIPVIYFHGDRDLVSPAETAPPRSLNNFHIIRRAGHLPFLKEEFSQIYEQIQQKRGS